VYIFICEGCNSKWTIRRLGLNGPELLTLPPHLPEQPEHAHIRTRAFHWKDISMRPDIEPEWLSIQDLMILTSLGRTKCYELVATGELEAIKVGRSVRVSRASYLEWTRRQRYMDVVADR
jgi:excisionase family DNA binding protein